VTSAGVLNEENGRSSQPIREIDVLWINGGLSRRILLVGCEPETLGSEEGQMGLSASVEAAVDEGVKVVESLVAKLLGGLALLIAGAGLIMAHPEIRKQVRGGLGRVLPGLVEPGNIAGGCPQSSLILNGT
jgi:hypothetical protein